MTLIEKLSNLGGIVDRDEMAKACSEIPDEDLRLALMTLALTYNQNINAIFNCFCPCFKRIIFENTFFHMQSP